MDGLPEPMAPIVPDLHGSSGADLFSAHRRQPPPQGMQVMPSVPQLSMPQQPVIGGSGPRLVAVSGTATAHTVTAAEPPAAQAANRQMATAPADVEMKECSRPTVTMPSLEDVSSALSGIELAKQLPTDPQEVHKRFQALMARNPPDTNLMKSIDNSALQLNCPPPLIRPRTPEPRTAVKHTLSAYSAHAPPCATRFVPQYKQTVLDHPHSGTTIKRYLRMGKPSNPQFTYHPPSRPTSRATSAGAGVNRSRSPPVNIRHYGGEGNADRPADDNQTVRKRCGCCMQVTCLLPACLHYY